MHLPASSHGITFIMHQHTCVTDIIGVEILDLEVVDGDRGFQQFMLDCLDHDILAVALNENVARTQVDCVNPALLWLVERMRRGSGRFPLHILLLVQYAAKRKNRKLNFDPKKRKNP